MADDSLPPRCRGCPLLHCAAMIETGHDERRPGVAADSDRGDRSASAIRPLLVRFGAMGDMVLVTPLIRALAEQHGAPVDILSTGGWTRPLLEGQPGVGRIHLLNGRKLPYWLNGSQRSLVAALRADAPRPTWYCDTDDRHLGLLARAGIGTEQVVRSSLLPMADGEHLIDYWQRLGRIRPPAFPGTGLRYSTVRGGDEVSTDSLPPVVAAEVVHHDPQLAVSPPEREALAAWLHRRGLAGRRLVLIQPGNKRTMRRGLRRRPSNTKWWPEAHWATVVRTIAGREPESAILLLGVPREADLNDEILALAGVATAINVAADLPLPRLLALQSVASGMISVDTGPAHTAAALGCPVVVLFGIADPVRIRPRGRATPVHVVTGEADGTLSMRGITVDAVIAAWDALPKR